MGQVGQVVGNYFSAVFRTRRESGGVGRVTGLSSPGLSIIHQ